MADVTSGAAGFEAMKAYENHCAQNGKPPSVSCSLNRGQNSFSRRRAISFTSSSVHINERPEKVIGESTSPSLEASNVNLHSSGLSPSSVCACKVQPEEALFARLKALFAPLIAFSIVFRDDLTSDGAVLASVMMDEKKRTGG